ncbi:UvrD-helicase domain-containing protein [Mesorhizobium sp. B2-1-3]|uniref:UvrD-helicase domain-containing protein n=1 Tax=Mesorhizobium sp. B2-1-3 TaxID=2589972 RepID=UPI001FEFAEFB|nr:UvrD-helicase domain-containing protein [Mesorhizobium sp. B2-1-3]
MAVEIDLLQIDHGAIVAPAGCGKTQLITDALSRHQGPKPILVLTHTNAGVAALRARLGKAGVVPATYRLATLDGFAIRLISTFPLRSGHDPRIIEGARPNYPAIRSAATGLVQAGHITDLLKASYDRLLVDEYQDCSVRQHLMVAHLAQCIRTVVVGDPFQAIFGFGGDALPAWNDVVAYFPIRGELKTPWRWINAGSPELGAWLLGMRDKLASHTPIDLRGAPGIEWVQLDGVHDEERRLAAGSADAPGETKVLIIGESTDPSGQRRIARRISGAVTVEAVDLRDLTDFGRTLDVGDPGALAVIAGYAEHLMSNFGGEDLVRSVAAAKANTLGRLPTVIEAAALNFEATRSLSAVSDLLVAINQTGGVYCYRPAVLAATQRALQLASPADGPSFFEATIIVREQSRLIGRPLARRSVGSTLLLKGLEAEVSVILNADTLNARNLYVAMTRGSKRVLVCATSPLLNPEW